MDYSTNKFGDVKTTDGGVVHLTQQAYVVNASGLYEAHGKDDAGNNYKAQWQAVDGWMDMDDESNCCDWSDYTVIKI